MSHQSLYCVHAIFKKKLIGNKHEIFGVFIYEHCTIVAQYKFSLSYFKNINWILTNDS